MYQYATSVPDKIALETEWLEGLKRAKLKRIEYSCSGACTAENIGEKVRIMAELQDAGGVIIGSIHIPFGKTWEFADPDESKRKPASDKTAAFIRACAPLKCKNFTLHGCLEPVPWDNPERAEWIKAFRKTLSELVPVAKEQGISINVEDLPRSCLGNTAEELAVMVDGFPMEQVGVCFDVNHFCGHPEKLVDGIKLLAPRIRTFHISDYDGIDECHWYPGMGVIDWAGIMEAVKQLPNDVLLMFEVFGFLNAPKWQNRSIAPDVIMKSFERNVFYLENAAEIQRRINELKID